MGIVFGDRQIMFFYLLVRMQLEDEFSDEEIKIRFYAYYGEDDKKYITPVDAPMAGYDACPQFSVLR